MAEGRTARHVLLVGRGSVGVGPAWYGLAGRGRGREAVCRDAHSERKKKTGLKYSS